MGQLSEVCLRAKGAIPCPLLWNDALALEVSSYVMQGHHVIAAVYIGVRYCYGSPAGIGWDTLAGTYGILGNGGIRPADLRIC